jgi:hypothetical protein
MTVFGSSRQDYSSWTDDDLYRAIDADPDCAAEYVEELKERKAAREAQAARNDELRAKYQI